MIYQPQLPPYAHQQEAERRLSGKRAFALLMEMRTGKTKVALDDFGRLELEKEVDRLLVVAPGGVYRTWEPAIKEHLSDDLLDRCQPFTWRSDGGKTFAYQMRGFLSNKGKRPLIFLVNSEALGRVKRCQDAVREFLSGRKANFVIDESTIIKNHSSKITEVINEELRLMADYRRILTGLISPHSPLDVYSQFEFLDPRILGFRSFYAFRGRFAVLRPIVIGGRAIQTVVGFRDLEELQARIAPHSFRVQLSDCYDLPPKIYERRDVDLTSEQEKAYREMLAYSTTQLASGDHVTATIVIAQIIRRHQILCGFVTDENGQFHEIPEKRTDALMETLEETTGKVIIWCAYDYNIRKTADAIAKAYGPQAVARFWGGNKNTREEEEVRFKIDPACRFMVATASAGGRGRTWSIASTSIYHSCTPNLEHRAQSEERPQGVGKAQSALYIDLMAPGKIEEKYIALLRKKIDLSTVINGDNYKEWLI